MREIDLLTSPYCFCLVYWFSLMYIQNVVLLSVVFRRSHIQWRNIITTLSSIILAICVLSLHIYIIQVHSLSLLNLQRGSVSERLNVCYQTHWQSHDNLSVCIFSHTHPFQVPLLCEVMSVVMVTASAEHFSHPDRSRAPESQSLKQM